MAKSHPIPDSDLSAADSNQTTTKMICDDFLALIRKDPKACSAEDVGLCQTHFRKCDICQNVLGWNEHDMKWRNAWEQPASDPKKETGTAVYIGVGICFLLGVLLYFCFRP